MRARWSCEHDGHVDNLCLPSTSQPSPPAGEPKPFPGQPNPLTVLTLADLRRRRSLKWRAYHPNVLPLWVAEMDTLLAPAIREALAEAVAGGDTGYAVSADPTGVVEAFAEFMAQRHGTSVEPAACTLVPDVLRGIGAVLSQLTGGGEGVLINPPVYHPFFSYIRFAGRRVVESPLVPDPTGRWGLDLDRLEADLARPEVTSYLLCNPHNPTGTVFGRSELLAIAGLAERHGVRMLVDEIHGPLVYPGGTFTPFLSLAGESAAAASAIVFTSASKAWNLPGLVAGLMVAGPDARGDVVSVPAPAIRGVGHFGVIAAEAAFRGGGAWLDALIEGLDANRKLLGSLLAAELPEIRYRAPDATYLAWLDCRELGFADPAAEFLRRGVAVNSGDMFGRQGSGHVRLNIATSPEILAKAVRRMSTDQGVDLD